MTILGTVNPGDEKYTLSGTNYWFMFPDRGTQGFSSSSPFAPKSVTGERSYADYDAVSAVAWGEMEGGMGQDRASDLTKYYNAIGVDARGSRIVLGPLVTEPTVSGLGEPTQLTYNHTFYPVEDIVEQAVISTVEVTFTHPTTWKSIDRIWLPLKVPRDLSTITVKLYGPMAMYIYGTGLWEIIPYAELGSTTIAEADLNSVGGWVQVIFSSQAALITNMEYTLQVTYRGIDDGVKWMAYRDDALAIHPLYWYSDPLAGPDGPAKLLTGAGEDLTLRVWAFAGRYVYYLTSDVTNSIMVNVAKDGATPSVAKRLGADITDAVFWEASGDTHTYLYIALGTSTNAQKFDANVGTEQWAEITDLKASRLCVYDNMLWIVGADNAVKASTDGTTWGEPVTVGANPKVYPARNIIGWDGYIWVGCDDGLYRIEYEAEYPVSTTPDVEQIIDFAHIASPVNFSFMCVHQGDLYFNLANGVIQYTSGGVVRSIAPETGINMASSERNVYRSAISTVGALWVGSEGPVDNASSILSYADGAWHPVVIMPRMGDMIRSIVAEPGYYSRGARTRFYFSDGLSIGYCDMPFTTTRRWLWSDMTYCAEGIIDLPWFDGNIRTIDKDWVSVECHVSGVGSGYNNKVYVTARFSESEQWGIDDVTVGTVEANGVTRLTFPVASYSAKIQLRLRLERTKTTSTPNVEAVVLRYVERPKDVKAFTRTYLLGTRQVWRDGTPFRLSLAEQVTQLETLRNSAEPLTWHPWFGGSYSVHIVDYNATEVTDERVPLGDPGSILVTLRLQVVE